jgi:subtilisin family serine protease
MRRFVLLLSAVILTACQDAGRPDPALSLDRTVTASGILPGRYIVTLQPSAAVASEASRLVAMAGGVLDFTYQHALKGFAARLSPEAASRLERDPAVKAIEPDRMVHALGVQSPAGQWGLDRIDQRSLPLDNKYKFDNRAMTVRVYIIDTGILMTHNEFKNAAGGTRASFGFNAINDGNGMTDCNGHGTHNAGVVGGRITGVAKSALLVSVRVLNCSGSGSISQVIAGLDWVTANAVKPAVANLTLGSSLSPAFNQAVINSINSGVVYALAAGSSAADACQFSPGSVPDGLTVAASDITDKKASFSNFGTCVDLFAPGVNIKSAWRTSNTATSTISGTTPATAHVAGAAAIYLHAHPTATPPTVNAAIINLATTGKLTGIGTGSPNRLLFTPGLGL